MKNLLLSFFIVLFFVSCEDNQINEFAMQAKIDNRLYQSTDARAFLNDNGFLVIEGTSQSESLTLSLSRFEEGTFNLGDGSTSTATFVDMDGNIYFTHPNGGGMVTISELNPTTRTLSGVFNFNAILPGIDTIYVSQGVLYNIPYTGGETVIPGEVGTLTAKVNGQPFLAETVFAMETGNSISITGSTLAATLMLNVPSNVEIGAFSLSEEGFSATYGDMDGVQATSEGTISIIEHDLIVGSLKGSFSFTTDRSEITEGQFEIIY